MPQAKLTSIRAILQGKPNRYYYTDGTGRVGIKWRGCVLWHSWNTVHGYQITGSTRNPGGKRDFVTRHRLEA